MAEDMKASARKTWEDIWPAGDVDALRETIAEDVVNHSAQGGPTRGIDGLIETMMWLRSGFSDQRYEIHRMVGEGDLLAVHLTHSGVHTGDFMGVAPTNRAVSYEHMHVLRFEGGKTVEHWAVHDTLTMLQQLGVIPISRAA